MNVADVRTLFAYNRWATERLLDAARSLDRAELTRDFGVSYRSVRGTLVHTLWSEWIWWRRWAGESPRQRFAEDDFPDVPGMAARWGEIHDGQRDFVLGLTERRLASRIAYENLEGERWEYRLDHMIQHVVNHSSYHRGQVVSLLRQLGRTPPTTDLLDFFDLTPPSSISLA